MTDKPLRCNAYYYRSIHSLNTTSDTLKKTQIHTAIIYFLLITVNNDDG